jgi:heme exporter protein B
MKAIRRITGVLYKEFLTEFKNFSSAASVFLFVLTSTIIVSYSISTKNVSDEIFAGITWVLIFFTSMIGQSRVFVSEEERGTWLFLKINSDSTGIYFGKLIYNIAFGIVANIVTVLLLLLFNSQFVIADYGLYFLCVLCGGIGISSASTIISALIAQASSKGALFPVLAFPLILPIILLSIDATILSIVGASLDRAYSDLGVIIAYSGAVVTASYILFDYIFRD